MKNSNLTVIVPCYNVSAYLSECLDSIRNQVYENFEVVLVNDGSTDTTGDICDLYANADPRFRVLHIKNSGSSMARYYGLHECRTEYVTFVDADDFIHPSMYLTLMTALLNEPTADLILCGVAEFNDGDSIPDIGLINDVYEKHTREQAVLRLLLDDEWKSYMCNKIYKKSLFNLISFPVARNLDEDYSIMHLVFHQANRILSNRTTFYYYRHRSGSTCLSFDVCSMTKKSYDRFKSRKERLVFVESHPEYHLVLNQLRNNFLAVGLAVSRIVAKYPSYFPQGFFELCHKDIDSIRVSSYMPQYFNVRKRIELLVLKHAPALFKIVYKVLPAW